MAEKATNVYVKLQSGERFDAVSEKMIAEMLNKLHPEYNARATIHAGDKEWLSVYGCPSDGFALSYKAPDASGVVYCSKMLSMDEAKAALGLFLRGESDWKESLSWKRDKPLLNLILKLLVVAVVISIVVFFVIDLLGWW